MGNTTEPGDMRKGNVLEWLRSGPLEPMKSLSTLPKRLNAKSAWENPSGGTRNRPCTDIAVTQSSKNRLRRSAWNQK